MHIFDLPQAAFHWPPPRQVAKSQPASAPVSPLVLPQQDTPVSAGSAFASAMRIASRTQPMIANLRSRAPSMSGVSGLSTNGLGFAAATGVRGGKAISSGLERSVGAAAGTFKMFRHAAENRLHLSNLAANPAAARVTWDHSSTESGLLVIADLSVRKYCVRRVPDRNSCHQQRQSVLNSRMLTSISIPDPRPSKQKQTTSGMRQDDDIQTTKDLGFWAPLHLHASSPPAQISPPLSHAEIETNASYQPFHSDRRVSLLTHLAYDSPSEEPKPAVSSISGARNAPYGDEWVFGEDLPARKVKLRRPIGNMPDLGALVDYGDNEAVGGGIVATTQGDWDILDRADERV